MSLERELRHRLIAAFQPTEIEVENESHRHAGHAGDDGTGESHFRIRLRRIARHRAVHTALGDLTRRIHALALDLG
jgi:BolA family transcriptional regulator, general stress-responsive regulator